MSKIKIEAGVCPKCGCSVLHYIQAAHCCRENYFYLYTCEYCAFEGEEIYLRTFIGHTDSKTREFTAV